MEHEGGLAGGARLNLGIETVALPMGEADGLTFGQTSPHGEIGHREVEGILELFGHVVLVERGDEGLEHPSGRAG